MCASDLVRMFDIFPFVSLGEGMLATGSPSQIIVLQTRTARVAMKLVRNLAAEVPVVTQLFLGLLQAPEQVLYSITGLLSVLRLPWACAALNILPLSATAVT